jgi:hypothetical protein
MLIHVVMDVFIRHFSLRLFDAITRVKGSRFNGTIEVEVEVDGG